MSGSSKCQYFLAYDVELKALPLNGKPLFLEDKPGIEIA